MNQPTYTQPQDPRESIRPLLPDTASAEARRHFSRLGLAYLILTIAFIGVAYIIQFALLFFCPRLLDEWYMSWVVSLLPLYGVGLPVLWLMLRRIPAAPHNADYALPHTPSASKTRFHIGHWMILLVIAFGCMTAGSLIGSFIMNFLSLIMNYDYAFAFNSMVDNSPVWMIFLGTCICAPLGEELLFRKLLLDRTRSYGDWIGILLSGLLFGLFHGNFFQFFYATLVGMLLAYVYTRSGSYWYCVAMHAVINFMGSIVTPALADRLPEDAVSFTSAIQPLIYLFLLLWQYGTLIAGIVLLCILWHRRQLSRGTQPLGRQQLLSSALINGGMIACAVVMSLLMLTSLIPIRG